MLKKEDSLKKRYFAKLFANLIGLAIGLVTQAIIPRGLGPKAYGDFSFLSNFFTQIVGFLDMGTSIGFYTKLSQRQRDFGLAFSKFASYFRKIPINISGNAGIDLERELFVYEEGYAKYKHDFIETEGTEETPFWQVVGNKIKFLHSGSLSNSVNLRNG